MDAGFSDSLMCCAGTWLYEVRCPQLWPVSFLFLHLAPPSTVIGLIHMHVPRHPPRAPPDYEVLSKPLATRQLWPLLWPELCIQIPSSGFNSKNLEKNPMKVLDMSRGQSRQGILWFCAPEVKAGSVGSSRPVSLGLWIWVCGKGSAQSTAF